LGVASLLGDGWFYISALGFIGSGALFLYLLGQYRSAVEETEESDASAVSLELPVKPVVVEMTPAPAPVPLVNQLKSQAAPALALPTVSVPAGKAPPVVTTTTANVLPDGCQGGVSSAPSQGAVAPGYTGPDRRRSDFTASSGLSPAVVYLQNIKSQMEKFEKEISALRSLSVQQAAQGELVLKRLSELAENVKNSPAPRSAVPALARAVEPAPQTAPDETPAKEAVELKPAKSAEPPPKRAKATPAAAKSSAVQPAEKKTEPPVAEQPERAPSVVLPAPAPEPEAKADPAPAPVIEALPQTSAVEAPAAPAAAVPADVAAPPEPDAPSSQPRKGPVWPV
jgi:hypothetical protein